MARPKKTEHSYSMDGIKKLVKDCSPFGKLNSTHVSYKAYAASIIVGLMSLGLTKEDVKEVFKELSQFGLHEKINQDMIDLVYSKIPSQDQSYHQDA